MTEDKYAVVDSWTKGPEGKDIELPSGQVCNVRELGVEDLLEHGLVEIFDVFGKQLAADPKPEGEEAGARSIFEMFKDKEKSEKFVDAVNKIVPIVVLAPKIQPVPPKGRPRNKANVYVDKIPLTDRMVIFSEAFRGIGGMSQFRQE